MNKMFTGIQIFVIYFFILISNLSAHGLSPEEVYFFWSPFSLILFISGIIIQYSIQKTVSKPYKIQVKEIVTSALVGFIFGIFFVEYNLFYPNFFAFITPYIYLLIRNDLRKDKTEKKEL